MRYYIIAGEASGDLHGSNLIKEIKKLDPGSEFRCWGGDLLKKETNNLVITVFEIFENWADDVTSDVFFIQGIKVFVGS